MHERVCYTCDRNSMEAVMIGASPVGCHFAESNSGSSPRAMPITSIPALPVAIFDHRVLEASRSNSFFNVEKPARLKRQHSCCQRSSNYRHCFADLARRLYQHVEAKGPARTAREAGITKSIALAAPRARYRRDKLKLVSLAVSARRPLVDFLRKLLTTEDYNELQCAGVSDRAQAAGWPIRACCPSTCMAR